MNDDKVISIGMHPRYRKHNPESLRPLMDALASQGMAMAALRRFGEESANVFIRDRDKAMQRYLAAKTDQRTTSSACPWNHASGDEFLGMGVLP
jgi:hypothetical protein